MAVDRKADHVGNHGGSYVDIYGNRKQFTYIDHDRHTSMLKGSLERDTPESKQKREEMAKELKEKVKSYKNEVIEEILALPAVSLIRSGNTYSEDFIIRDEQKGILWNEAVVRDALNINDNLRYTIRNIVWKNTVKEQYWFSDMDHEDIIKGKWREWI